jgi:Na+-driven multidrug efflux pump
VSRVRRASVAASFAYVQFALSIVVGIGMVPFILSRVDAVVYGVWLASGEVLAYAAMADLGIVGIVPWIVADADGRKDRQAIRTVMANGFCAAGVMSLGYLLLVALLWQLAPSVVTLTPAQRELIGGPLAIMACVTGIVLPFRVANATLHGLQDVRVSGFISTGAWLLDVVLTATMLALGYGLYALAVGASVPALAGVMAATVRLRVLAPDLLRAWPRPRAAGMLRLFRDGFGGWLGAWGWRLAAATDGIVLTFLLGQPLSVTRLAMTSKLGQVLMQLAWVPGDSGLVGLAQLSGEGHRERLRGAVAALFRMYLTLACAGAIVVLVANGPFVRWWLPDDPPLFAGALVNGLLAAVLLVFTAAHAFAVTVSVLGHRLRVGVVTLIAGVVQVGLAYVFARRFGLAGIPLAAIVAQVCVLFPLLLGPLASVSGVSVRVLLADVMLRWSARSLPALLLCGFAGVVLAGAPLLLALPLAVASATAYLWISRSLILDYAPVADLLRRPLRRLRLEGLLPAAPQPEEAR